MCLIPKTLSFLNKGLWTQNQGLDKVGIFDVMNDDRPFTTFRIIENQ
jgi:hypothetical protein